MSDEKQAKTFEIKIVASAWHDPDKFYKAWTRRWNGPPIEGHHANLASCIEKKLFWPFAKYEWYVYSPFCNDSIDGGECLTLEEAMAGADKALEALCVLAARA
jgi:hypothetical protein